MAFTLYNKTATSSTEKLSLIMFAQLWEKQSLGLRGPSESSCNTNAQLWKLVQAIPFRKGAPNGLIIAWYLISDVNIWSRFQSLAKRLLKIPEKKKKSRQAGFICTSKLSYDRKCSKYHPSIIIACIFQLVECWQVLSLGQPSISQAIPWHHYGIWDPSWPSQTLFCGSRRVWWLRDDSDSSLFAPVGLNASKHSLALFHLVLETSPQGPHIIIFLLTVLPTIESSVTALECAHHFV